MLTELGFRPPCLSYGPPSDNPNWLSVYSLEYQKWWKVRRLVQVPTEKYYFWLYRVVWDCDVTLSGFTRTDPDENGVRQESTILNLTKIGTINLNRENKLAQVSNQGLTTFVPNPDFNKEPNKHGTNPSEWLMLQRHNICDGSNASAAYFTLRTRINGQQIGSRNVSEPLISFWDGAPTNASQITISSRVKNDTRTFYASYVLTEPFERTLSVQPVGTGIFATHYDPTKNKIWPLLLFGGSPATVNWQGLVPADNEQPSSHTITTSLSIDSVQIPAGTSWAYQGSSGQLNISVRWYVKTIRDL